jgi:multidrug efflux pump subunit AcrA (membrane-fusion protein)
MTASPQGSPSSSHFPPAFLDTELPHWGARGLAYVLILLFTASAVASVVIQVPETVSSPFELVPVGGTDPVRASRDGFVVEVHAADGQVVPRGQTLFVIRSEATGDRSSELAALEVQRTGASESLVNAAKKHEAREQADAEEERRLEGRVAFLAQRIERTQRTQTLQLEVQEANLVLAQAELDGYKQERAYRQKVESVASDMAMRAQSLLLKRAISEFESLRVHLDAQRSMLELDQTDRALANAQMKLLRLKKEHASQKEEWALTLDQLQAERTDTQANLAKLRHERTAAQREFAELERSLKETAARSSIRIEALRRELDQSRDNQVAVPAPQTGTVLRLQVKGTGAFVRTGDVLCELAEEGKDLQAELAVSPEGVGRIDAGQRVKLLYEAFPYQRYGVKYGTVRWVSPASVLAHDARTFRVLAESDERTFRVEGQDRPLRAGMGGRAEVVVGRRSLVSYAFEPLRQLQENFLEPPAATSSASTGR